MKVPTLGIRWKSRETVDTESTQLRVNRFIANKVERHSYHCVRGAKKETFVIYETFARKKEASLREVAKGLQHELKLVKTQTKNLED